MNVAVIVGGGTGERAGIPGGKQLAPAAGRPVIAHAIRAFERSAAVDAIVVVAHPDRVEEYRAVAVGTSGASKVAAVVPGGETRQRSVANGLAVVPARATLIAVHDGARPLVTAATIDAAFAMLEEDTALAGVVVGHPVYDTLKVVDADERVVATADRSSLWAAQTPQVFRAEVLRDAYERASAERVEATDDAALVERIGGTVRMMAGPRENIKVTVPDDLWLADHLLTARAEGERDG